MLKFLVLYASILLSLHLYLNIVLLNVPFVEIALIVTYLRTIKGKKPFFFCI